MRGGIFEVRKQNNIRFRVYIMGIFLLLLPVDAALGNILGQISIINYIVIFYVLIRILNIFKENFNGRVLVKCKIQLLYFMYFMFSISWSITNHLNLWYILSLVGSFIMFVFSVADIYSASECKFLKKSVTLSGVIVVITSLLNFRMNSDNRFFLNIGRYMDPNYFAIGLILITAILMDNIFEKKHKNINIIILVLLIIIVVMTGSRGGLIANSAVIFTFFIFNRKSSFKKIAILLFGLMIFILIFNFIKDMIPKWVISRFNINEILGGTGSGRTVIWTASLSYYKDLPVLRLLFGTGFSTQSYISLITMGIPKVSHSIYVQSLLEGGIIGLMITIINLIIPMMLALKNKKIYIFAAIVGMVIGGITLDIHISRFFWNILFFSTLPSLNHIVINTKNSSSKV